MTTQAMMSVKEVQCYTSLSKTSVFKLIKERKLEKIKVLNRTLITRASVEALCGRPRSARPDTVTQPNIGTLPLPDAGYMVDKDTRRMDGVVNFETPQDCRVEDGKRARKLRGAIQKHADKIDLRSARRLAAELERSGESGEYPDSPASSYFMGDQRRRIIGALWKLLEE